MLRVLRARTVQMVSRDLLGPRVPQGLLVLREPTGLPVLMGPRVPQGLPVLREPTGLPVLMGPRVLRDLPAIFPVWN